MLLEQEFSMFAARCQNAKKNFCNWQHLLEVHCIFFFSVLSVSILRFEELAQSLQIFMLVLKSILPWSHIDHELCVQASFVQGLHRFWKPWLETFPTGISYLSSYVSTSEKFLISMAHLLNPKAFPHLFGDLWPCQSTIWVQHGVFCILSNKQLCLTASDSTGGLEAGSCMRGSIASSKHFELERSNAPSRP